MIQRNALSGTLRKRQLPSLSPRLSSPTEHQQSLCKRPGWGFAVITITTQSTHWRPEPNSVAPLQDEDFLFPFLLQANPSQTPLNPTSPKASPHHRPGLPAVRALCSQELGWKVHLLWPGDRCPGSGNKLEGKEKADVNVPLPSPRSTLVWEHPARPPGVLGAWLSLCLPGC